MGGSMTSVFVDSSGGNDSGAGTVGDPWLTLQHAVDTITDGSSGNQINARSNAAHTTPTTTGVVWTSYSPTNSETNPLRIRGYTTTENDGGVAEITGNNSSASCFAASSHPSFTYYVDLQMHNTTADVIDAPADCAAIRCEVYNGGSTDTLDLSTRGVFFGCNVHTGTAGAVGIHSAGQSKILFNRVTGHDDAAIVASTDVLAIGNLCHNIAEDGINVISDGAVLINNTLVGDSSAGDFGIEFNTNIEHVIVLNNIIKDFGTSGTGAAANFVATSNALILGYNNLHGNDDDAYDNELVVGLDLTSNDTTTDPTFTNAGSNDYTVGTNAQADGYPESFLGASSSTSSVDVGACQRVEAGGGGGGGKQAGGGGGQVG